MKPSKNVWVLVTDGSFARIYKKSGSELQPVGHYGYAHPETREHDRSSDKPGRVFESAKRGRHAYEPHTDHLHIERHAFATQLAEEVQAAYNAHQFDSLIIVSSPEILGELRKILSKEVLSVIREELVKDIAHFTDQEVTSYLKRTAETLVFP